MHLNILDLEEKKQKIIEGGASADEVRVCTICNVVCNSAKVFASHLAGEKHALKALGTNYRKMAPNVMARIKQMSYAKRLTPKAFNKITASGVSGAPKTVQTFTCEVCKIECNSQETLNTHKMGKKHKGNLQKLQEKITLKPSAASAYKNISAGQDQNTNVEVMKKTSSTKEGLLSKRDKIVQGGAAEEAIMKMSSTQSSTVIDAKNPKIYCRCNLQCTVFTSYKDKYENRERKFYRCPRNRSENDCNFFKWMDEVDDDLYEKDNTEISATEDMSMKNLESVKLLIKVVIAIQIAEVAMFIVFGLFFWILKILT